MALKKWLKVKKYYYDIFLRPLSPLNKIKVVLHKTKGSFLYHNTPQSLEIGVTYHCQLNCIHCGIYGQSKLDQPELDAEEIKKVVLAAHDLGVYLIVFSGGEPLLREEIIEFIGFASCKGLIPALSTNGQLLTKDLVHRLKERKLAFINISIDSPIGLIHDKYRGISGCFQKAEEAIRICVNEDVSVIISTYATKENIRNGDLRDLIRFSKQSGAKGVRILLSVPAGKWLGCFHLMLSEQDKQYIRNLLDPLYVYIEGVCNKFTECSAANKRLFYISPYGEVQPCSFVPVSFGNIREEPLPQIWRRISRHNFFNRFDGLDCIMRDKEFYKQYLHILQRENQNLPIRI